MSADSSSSGIAGGIASTSTSTNTNTSTSTSTNRARINSRDIVRSYSGLFGRDGDLTPFELARNAHTDWVEKGGFLLLASYVGCICLFQILVLAVFDSLDANANINGNINANINGNINANINANINTNTNTNTTTSTNTTANTTTTSPNLTLMHWSWTVTHAMHCLVTTIYVHWLKGSAFDIHGELAAMTLWEQLEGRSQILNVKRTLFIVPTVLCYAACHFSNYSYGVCVANVVLWIVQMAGKLPIMNGVRIFGINRTAGIDDDNDNNNDNDNDDDFGEKKTTSRNGVAAARNRRRLGSKHD